MAVSGVLAPSIPPLSQTPTGDKLFPVACSSLTGKFDLNLFGLRLPRVRKRQVRAGRFRMDYSCQI